MVRVLEESGPSSVLHASSLSFSIISGLLEKSIGHCIKRPWVLRQWLHNRDRRNAEFGDCVKRVWQLLSTEIASEAAEQVAAPAESSNTQLAPGIHQALTECGWKGGDSLIGKTLWHLRRSALDCSYDPLCMWESTGSHSLNLSFELILHATDFDLETVDQKIARPMVPIVRLSNASGIGYGLGSDSSDERLVNMSIDDDCLGD